MTKRLLALILAFAVMAPLCAYVYVRPYPGAEFDISTSTDLDVILQDRRTLHGCVD